MPQRPIFLSQDIAEAQGTLRGLLDRALATTGTGVTSTEYVVLRVLTLSAPDDLHDFLAGQPQLGLDRAGVADLLGGLQDRGLIRGEGPMEMTDEGTALYGKLTDSVGALTQRLYSGFDPDDLATAHRVLTEVTEQARRLRDDL